MAHRSGHPGWPARLVVEGFESCAMESRERWSGRHTRSIGSSASPRDHGDRNPPGPLSLTAPAIGGMGPFSIDLEWISLSLIPPPSCRTPS